MIHSILKKIKRWKKRSKIGRENPELWLVKKEKVRLGYIQIPKVATRSIQLCMAQYYTKLNNEPTPETWRKEDIRYIENKTARHLSQKEISNIAGCCFIFAFVRNPYDRLYSAYKNKVIQPLKVNGKNIFEHHGIELGISFKQFVDIVISIPDNEIDRHLRSQSWFLTFEGKVIPQYIGYLETFDKDWAKLKKQFALGDILHRNSTENLDLEAFRSQYDKESEGKVFNRYKDDFELFGYERIQI
ncbi:MAG: hypothetical protein COB22_00045 [Cycloclasticus sp.]|nr:MAG: hypothetical protein COB22_00045 [Cycloclasticus sp.]